MIVVLTTIAMAVWPFAIAKHGKEIPKMTEGKRNDGEIYKIIPKIMAEVGAIGKTHTAS